jgi:thioredoxin-related protein
MIKILTMNKLIFFFAVLMLQTININAQDSNDLNWIDDFKTAKKIASKEHKPILIFFTGSDWCSLCKMIEKDFFASKKFLNIAKNDLVLYKADFPRRTDIVSEKQKETNENLSKKYSKTRSKRVYPTIVMINAKGKELDFIESYNYIHDTTRHFKLLELVLKLYKK